MRAIGASRRQVTRSVLLEAGVVGLIASALGLAAGVGVAAGLKALLLSGIGIDIPAGGIVLSSKTVIVSTIAGLGVSVVSAVFPARRAAKVPPIAAMREVAVDHSSRSRRRVINGSIVTGTRCSGDGRRALRRCRYRPGRSRCRAGLHRRRRARSGAGPSDQPGHRFAAAPPEGRARQLGHGRTRCATRSAPRQRLRR